MKRRLLIVAVFLLAGAVANVAVAWFFVMAPPPHRRVSGGFAVELRRWVMDHTPHSREPISAWPREVPHHWPQFRSGTRHRRIGSGMDRCGALQLDYSFIIQIKYVGWPLWSLESEAWINLHVGPNRTIQYRTDGHPEHTWWLTGIPVASNGASFVGDQRCLPIRPRWPGFAVNTLFYAAILWLPFVLRRWLRVRRGLCPKCAYPMGESAVCSECGRLHQPGTMSVVRAGRRSRPAG